MNTDQLTRMLRGVIAIIFCVTIYPACGLAQGSALIRAVITQENMQPAIPRPEQDLIAELKWLHEFDNRNCLEGDTIFFKVLTKF